MNFRNTFVTLLLILTSSTLVHAQVRVQHEEPAAVENALFGWASSISGHKAVVTAPQKDIDGLLSKGSAIFYELTNEGWVIETETSPAGLPAFANFGISAVMNSEEAFIGSLGDDSGRLFSGTVYVYQHNDTSWINTQVIHPSDIKIGTRFGHSIDVEYEGDEFIVGAYMGDGTSNKSGAAYIFKKENEEWVENQKIYPKNGESHDYFGHNVRFIGDDIVAVGAYNATGADDQTGAVYIFEKNESGVWQETAKLFDPSGVSADLFGYSIAPEIGAGSLDKAFSTGKLLVGAPGKDKEETIQSGSVYFYSKTGDTWNLDHQLFEENTEHNDHFGVSIAHNSEIGLFIGAAHAGLTNQGNIFRYDYSTASEFTVLEPIDFFPNENTIDSQYYGSKLIVNHEADFIIASPHKTMSELENAGDVEFYSLGITNSSEEELEIVKEYKLEQNYPNPFNPTTTLKYQVKEAGDVTLTVFNLLGQTVQVLVNERQTTGAYTATFNASALSSGFYFYRLEVNDFSSTKKMMLIK